VNALHGYGLPLARCRELQRLIDKSPSPALAGANLRRLIESGGTGNLKRSPQGLLSPLIRLLGGSAYLSEILIREGKSWPHLLRTAIHTTAKSAAQHLTELSAKIGKSAQPDEVSRTLRRHKQREYLRIGVRDLISEHPVDETVTEVTALAEASLEIAYRSARAAVERDFGALNLPGRETPNRFVILGMGKLGGAELNFSSDIDIVYLSEEDEGESAGGVKGRLSPREFFAALAEKITRAMGEVTEDGFVFRTDLRLRPLGRHGPMVQSLDSALLYYESWGQCWERSALIKARPVAGDKELGASFLSQVEPFIYRRYLDFTTVEELREMKARIERELLVPSNQASNVKLGPGGIREIEFFAQALQLVNGGYEPLIRELNTIKALALLASHGFVPPAEAKTLSRAYLFLRNVEHKIQIVQEGHTHSIPAGKDEQEALARRLGYEKSKRKSAAAQFRQDYRRHTRAVRAAFDRLFYSAQKENETRTDAGSGAIWHDLDDEELFLDEIRRLGFTEPEKAYHNLLAVRDGERYSPPSPRRLKVMRTLGPALVQAILHSSAPDRALFNLAEFSHRIGARTGFLSLLSENPKTMRLLVNLFAGSQFLTDLFLQRPELLDSLIRTDLTRLKKSGAEMLTDLTGATAGRAEIEDKLNAMRRVRAEEFLRIGLGDLGGGLDLLEIFDQLTALADACVKAALDLSLQEIEKSYGRIGGGRFAVLGMGKLGGRELDYNSDLDLIFIYDASEDSRSAGGASGPLDAHDYYVRLGQKLITFLSASMVEGVLYKIDMRLRPSGRAGPIVTSLAAFRHYHETGSELWERQALIKMRAAGGDASLGRDAEAVARAFAYGKGLTQAGVAEIDHLRMRMEKELAQESDSQFNLKKGMGGMVDIEFLAQMLQLTQGYRETGVQQQGTLAALKALSDLKIIGREEYRLLSDGYLFLRRLDHRLRLERQQSIDLLERDPVKLQSIALALGYKGKKDARAGKRLLEDYEKLRQRIRARYERRFRNDNKNPSALAANSAGGASVSSAR